MTEPVLNTSEAAQTLGLAVTTLEKLRVHGGGPRYVKLGRAVRYRNSDLESWLDDRLRASTSEKQSLDFSRANGSSTRQGPSR